MGLQYLAYLSSVENLAGWTVTAFPPQLGHFSDRLYLPHCMHFSMRLFNWNRRISSKSHA